MTSSPAETADSADMDTSIVAFAEQLADHVKAGNRPGMLRTGAPYAVELYGMCIGQVARLSVAPSPAAAARAALTLIGCNDVANMGLQLLSRTLAQHPLFEYVRLALAPEALASAGYDTNTLGETLYPHLAVDGRSVLEAVRCARVLAEVRRGDQHHIFGESSDVLYADLDAVAALQERFVGRPDAQAVFAALVRDARGVSPERLEAMIETALVV